MTLLVALSAVLPAEDHRSPPLPADPDTAIEVTDCLARFPHRRRLSSERAGILATVPDEGERFAAGAVVARLRDDVPRAALAVAAARAESDAAVRAARKAHELSRQRLDKILAANRQRPNTFDSDEVHQAELEEARAAAEVEAAESELKVNTLAVAEARAELATYELRTDRGGIVTRVTRKEGEGVQLGDEVLELVDTGSVRVQGYVGQQHLRRLRPGLPVKVEFRLPTDSGDIGMECFEGTLGFVDVALTSGQEVRVWADIANRDDLLREGLLGRMILLPDSQDVAGRVAHPDRRGGRDSASPDD